MKPKTEAEKKAARLSSSLKALTPAQQKWGFDHVLPHACVFIRRKHLARCIDCGHVWHSSTVPNRCPSCGKTLSVAYDSRKKKCIDEGLYDVIQKKGEHMVIRQFYVYREINLKNDIRRQFMNEIVQHWVDARGQCTTLARSISMYYYYRRCPFSINSELSIKRVSRLSCGYLYHMEPDRVYPVIRPSHLLLRNGFDKKRLSGCPEVIIKNLLGDNRFETIWKLGMEEFIGKYLSGDKRIQKYWKSVMLYHRNGYKAYDVGIWLDYLELLDHFGMDHRNPTVALPVNLEEAHDSLSRRRRNEYEREIDERRRERDKAKISAFMEKKKFFSKSFHNDRIKVIVLASIAEYKNEGDVQHHCVYTNEYYAKKDSLILSARMIDNQDVPIETIEISLENGSVLQCFGKYNKPTEYHEEIIELVRQNAAKMIKTATIKQ